MNNSKVLVATQDKALNKFGFIFCLGIVLLAPLLLTQSITGPAVNMALFLSAYIYGLKKESLTIALIPSIVALSIGQLPIVLLPMVPFIVAGNIFLMYFFSISFHKTNNYLLSVFTASVIKFFVLYLASQILIILFANTLFTKFSIMMSWPQLASAIIGGLASYSIVRFLNRPNR